MTTRRQILIGTLSAIAVGVATPIILEGTPAMAATSPNLGFRYFGITVTPVTGTFNVADFDEQMGFPITVPLTGGKTATGKLYGTKIAPGGVSADIYIKCAAISVTGLPPSSVVEFPTDPTIGA